MRIEQYEDCPVYIQERAHRINSLATMVAFGQHNRTYGTYFGEVIVEVSVAAIRQGDCLTTKQRIYWDKLASELRHKVDVVDPARISLDTLRTEYPQGTRVYRASTGGKWGKSAEVVTL